MREIKFKCWDTDDKKMSYEPSSFGDLGGNGFDPSFVFHYRQYQPFQPRFILMQFTGLKDTNGKEIYEGDIVAEFRTGRSSPDGRTRTRIIEWNDNMTLDDSYGETAVGFNLGGGVLEVIGNIYENPELLKA